MQEGRTKHIRQVGEKKVEDKSTERNIPNEITHFGIQKQGLGFELWSLPWCNELESTGLVSSLQQGPEL